MLSGLMLNALVTEVNQGRMPVVGMPSHLHPMNSTWQVATSKTRLAFLADQARLGMFSLGDIALLLGGSLILAVCILRLLKIRFGLKSLLSVLLGPSAISGRPSLDAPILRSKKGDLTRCPSFLPESHQPPATIIEGFYERPHLSCGALDSAVGRNCGPA